jgi:hypothetical protein
MASVYRSITREGFGLLFTLSTAGSMHTFLQGTVAELAVLAGLATGEVDLVAKLGRWGTSEGFCLCFSNLNQPASTVCKRFVVVVVLRDLLQMEPLVPALFLPHKPHYLLFQLV